MTWILVHTPLPSAHPRGLRFFELPPAWPLKAPGCDGRYRGGEELPPRLPLDDALLRCARRAWAVVEPVERVEPVEPVEPHASQQKRKGKSAMTIYWSRMAKSILFG